MGSEGYLINQFFSPVTNKRRDEWGGDLENRVRFAVETMKAVRIACGDDFPVIFRMSGIDLIPGSNGWEETFYFAKRMQQSGANALNIGIGWHESRIPTISMLVPRAYYGFAAERIKHNVTIPCISSNRINDPEVAEEMLATGKADLVSLARPLLADPDFALKAESGKSGLINTCIACNQACLDNAFRNEPTTCILNPEAGREREMELRPAAYAKRVAVVGAGPAGLEACKVLAQRGHQVTLFEKGANIGGQLLHAVLVPGKQEFLNTIRYYKNYLKENGVRIEFKSSPSPEDLQKFDAVIVATGARPRMADISGSDRTSCISYEDFFNNPAAVKNSGSIAVIGAGGIGCDVAHLLADVENAYPPASFFDDPNRVALYEQYLESLPRNHEITLMRRGKRIGEKLGPTTRWALIQLLENRGVKMLTQIQYQSVSEKGVSVLSRNGKEIFIQADKVIFATGQICNSELYDQIHARVEECYLIGAARTASETNAQGAIWEAAETARKI
jgi:2,4-dienoyl-CoA reductase (NADPH2)